MLSRASPTRFRATELRVLKALDAGDSVLLVTDPAKPDLFRCAFKSAPSEWGVCSYRLLLKLEGRGFLTKRSELEFVITELGCKALASREVDPLELLEDFELLEGLPRPRRREFLLIMENVFRLLRDAGVELTPELIRSAAVEAVVHVRAGGSWESFTRTAHVPKGKPVEEPVVVVEPVVLRSNSSPVAGNQFRSASSLRRKYGRATHKR